MNTAIQRILVPLDPSNYTQAATARACHVARRHSAQLEGVTVLDLPEIRSHIPPMDVAYWPLIEERIKSDLEGAREKIKDCRDRFVQTCEQERVAHSEMALEGLPAHLILEASALYDLVVMGLKTFFDYETRPDHPGNSLDKILDRTATPVLAVPGNPPRESFQRVLIAYDGSFSASRALRDFAAFAQPFEFEITLFTAQKEPKQAESLIEHAGAYLRAHRLGNFKVLNVDRATDQGLAQMLALEYDLIVAGIHARKFLKDAFVGSFTKRLIDLDQTALFLSH